MVIKTSDITVQDVADFIRLDEVGNTEFTQLTAFLTASKDFVRNYTGLEDLDEFSDLTIVVLILCQDMYDNRSMYVDKNNMNKVVQTILDMHTRTNLC